MHPTEKLGVFKNQNALQNGMFWFYFFFNLKMSAVFSGTFNSSESILTAKPQNI